ncbi:MAG: hypothetical protein IKA36_01450, partial [Clostridia bacterium]|nr:hypothetical protein [Clostridia bacterium]
MKKIDENYFKNSKTESSKMTDIQDIVNKGEQILWRGKPKKSAFILGSIFNMLPIGLIWLLFDGAFIAGIIATGSLKSMPVGVII